MKKANFSTVIVNFLGVLLLVTLIMMPLYFAKNFTKVAGVKSESKFLVVSQIEKFPGMTLTQDSNQYQITFNKLGPSQSYLGVLILNNPTSETKTYQINIVSGQTQVFFGEDLANQTTLIKVPATSSVPISLLSENDQSSREVQFSIKVN